MSQKSIFIVGNSRSGTTMLGRIFDKHSEVHTFREIHFFDSLVPVTEFTSSQVVPQGRMCEVLTSLLQRQRAGLYADDMKSEFEGEALELASAFKGKTMSELFAAFLSYEASNNDKQIPCKQSPYYLSYVAEIEGFIESPYFIYLVRDPRDVALSQKNRWRRNSLGDAGHPFFKEVLRSWANYHPYITTKIWLSCQTKANRLSNKSNFKQIRYEDLVSKPEEVLVDICSWIGIDYQMNMLNVEHIGSSIRMDKSNAVGLDASRVNSWKNGSGLSKVELFIIQKLAAKQMEVLEYEPVPASANIFAIFSSAVIGVLKAFISVLLNALRFKNIFVLIKRRMS